MQRSQIWESGSDLNIVSLHSFVESDVITILVMQRFQIWKRLYILILFFPGNSLYPALMLFSPERTSCFSFSLFESNIFFPLKYVSVDTPAVSANLARTSILFLESTVVEEICENCSLIGFTNFGKGFEEICKGYLQFPPELGESVSLGLTPILGEVHLSSYDDFVTP